MTRQQRWAKKAFERVTTHLNTKDESKYRRLYLKMPALLKQSGVVQSLAFLRARDGGEGRTFCDELAEVYGLSMNERAGEALQKKAQEATLDQYLVLSRDLIEISVWFRRFAQSELKDEQDTDEDRNRAETGGRA